ncbi:hypothetical protein PMAYCL1PPCAC_01951, partial [Pristionchus mayeri]
SFYRRDVGLINNELGLRKECCRLFFSRNLVGAIKSLMSSSLTTLLSFQCPISILPDELLAMIFENLSTRERAPLGLVSKRFRSVDLGIGKREFGCVVLGFWQNQEKMIRALFSSLEEGNPKDGYHFITSPHEYHTDVYPHMLKLLQNSTTDLLFVRVEGIHDSGEASVISSLFKSIRFKNLEVSFKGSDDMSKFGLSFFTSIKNCQNRFDEIHLFWDCECRQNIHTLRQAFLQLPKT